MEHFGISPEIAGLVRSVTIVWLIGYTLMLSYRLSNLERRMDDRTTNRAHDRGKP